MIIERAIAVLSAAKIFDKDNAEDCEAVSLAIEALEKQFPGKPGMQTLNWLCPRCKSENEMMFRNSGCYYCYHCGQAIDWSKE